MLSRTSRLIVAAIVGLGFAASSNAAVITQWNFNSVPPDAAAATGTTSTSIGTGTASLIGGTTSTFASGDANGGSSDPTTGSPTDDSGWNTTGYPTQGTGSGTAGVSFQLPAASVPTSGNLYFYVDQRHSNSSSRFVQFTASRTGFSSVSNVFTGAAGDTWFNGRQLDISSLVGASADPITVTIAAVFEPSTSAYAASSTSYATTGTYRFDMATFANTPVPEPVTLSLLAGIGAMALRRRAK